MSDVETRAKLKLTGDIEIGTALFAGHFTGLEIRREGATWRLRLDAPLSELRKLAAIDSEYAAVLGLVADERPDANASLTLSAAESLTQELNAAEPADALPQQWLDAQPFAALIFALDRWTPESVGIVTSTS